MMTTTYEVDGASVELECLTKSQLEILFRHCMLRGDTARISKQGLVDRISSCDEQIVLDGLGEMVDGLDLALGDEKQQSNKGRTPPQRHPLTAMVKAQGVQVVDVPFDGAILRISIQKIGGWHE